MIRTLVNQDSVDIVGQNNSDRCFSGEPKQGSLPCEAITFRMKEISSLTDIPSLILEHTLKVNHGRITRETGGPDPLENHKWLWFSLEILVMRLNMYKSNTKLFIETFFKCNNSQYVTIL